MGEWNYEVDLIGITVTQDKYLNEKETEIVTTVLCKKKSITQNEFYNAGQDGYKPEVTLVVHSFEYENQRKVRFEDTTYRVIRTYAVNDEELELVCGVTTGGN